MLWTTSHLLSVEDRFTKLASNAYLTAIENIWAPVIMGTRPGKGRREITEWLITTAQIYDLPPSTMIYDDLATQSHEVEHTPRGVGLRIDRAQWADDEFQLAYDWFEHIGGAMALDGQRAAVDLIKSGEAKGSYDGVPFFSKSHPNNPKAPAAGTYATLIDDVTQIGGTVAELKAALGLASGDSIPTQTANDHWYLTAVAGETPGQLPLVRSERETYALNSYTGVTQAELNRMDALEWQLRGRFGHMYGHPYQMIKVKLPLCAYTYQLVVAYMKSIKMPNGLNRNLRPSRVVTAPKMEIKALELTSAGFIGATENVLRSFRVEPLTINELAI